MLDDGGIGRRIDRNIKIAAVLLTVDFVLSLVALVLVVILAMRTVA